MRQLQWEHKLKPPIYVNYLKVLNTKADAWNCNTSFRQDPPEHKMNYIHIGFQRGSLGQAEFCPHLNDLNRLASPSLPPCAIWPGMETAEIFASSLKSQLQFQGEGRGVMMPPKELPSPCQGWLVCRDKPQGHPQSRKQAEGKEREPS